MIADIQKLIDDYANWLKDKTSLREVKDWVEITTPFLDRHNDYIQIYAKKQNGNYLLTDDSYTIEDLRTSGCELDTPKRKLFLDTTLNGFGVRKNDEEALHITASETDFAQKKHRLVQAILAVDDLFYTSNAAVQSLFVEDVSTWLDDNEIRYTTNVLFPGRTSFDHHFEFVIPKSKHSSERILKTITHPTKNNVQALLFAWVDTKDNRPDDSKAYAILNDIEKNVSSSLLSSFENYNVSSILWNTRDKHIDELAA